MVAVATELGDPEGIALALYCQADLPWSEGNFAEAARLYHEAAETATRVNSRSLAATIRRSEAEVLAEGDDSQLAASLDGVIDEFRAIGDPQGLAVTLAVLAGAELGSGAGTSAASHAAEGLDIARKHGYNEIRWRHLTLLAWAAAALGETEQAARLLGAVEATVERAGGKVGLGQGNATDRERVRSIARSTLGDRYSALYAEGRCMPENDAEALAMSLAVRWEGPTTR